MRAVDRPGVVVTVAASDRVAEGLAVAWRQRRARPGLHLLGGSDLLVAELAHGVVPGFGGPDDRRVADLVADAARHDVPLVLWVTSGGPDRSGAGWEELAQAAVGVFVVDRLDEWRSVVPTAQLLPVAGNPRAPVVPACDRAVVLAAGPVSATSSGEVATVLGPAVRGLGDRIEVHLLETSLPARAFLPSALAKWARRSEYAEASSAVARAAVLLDGPRRSPGDMWALLDAAAAGTAVVSLPGLTLPGEIPVTQPSDAAAFRGEVVARLEQPELRDREALVQRRAVLAHHTFRHRAEQIVAAAGLGDPGPNVASGSTSVSAVVPTNRPGELENVLANIGRQAHRDTELVLVLHGIEVDRADLRARARDLGVAHLEVLEAPGHLTLGACLGLGVAASSGRLVGKLDDDNFYGRHYLTDLVQALEVTGAGIAGKWAHYVWLRSTGAVVLRYPEAEHAWSRRIQGGSMLFDGDVVRGLGFSDLPRAVDSDILDRAIAAGVRIWSADRFNFVSVRGDDRTAHTWTVEDASFLTGSGRLSFYGDPRSHVEV